MESSDDEVEARALKILEEATEQEWRVYDEATAPARKAYEEALTKILQTYRETEKILEEAKAQARKAYAEATEPARQAYLEAKARKEAEGAPDEPTRRRAKPRMRGRAEAQVKQKMCGNEKPEGECTPTSEWGDLNQLRELAEKIKGDRTALRAALKRLDEALTPSFSGAGVKVAYRAWSIQKYDQWWGIWYIPEDSDNLGDDSLETIGDAPHKDLMAFVEYEGAELLTRYVAALQEKAPQIKADVELMEKVLNALS